MRSQFFIAIGILVLSLDSSQSHSSDVAGIQDSLFGRWFLHIISRGFYALLISLILICSVVSTIKNKLRASQIRDQSTENESMENEYNAEFEKLTHVGPDDSLEVLKNKLRQAEEMIGALQTEIGQTQKTVMNLETTVEDMEKSTTFSKDELITTRLDIALEIENSRHENAVIQRQLDEAKAENERLLRQIETMQREARISEAAIRDQQSLSERLRGARTELDGLKSQLQGIKVERDTAVRIAAEHIYKMTPEMTPQKIEVIEAMIDVELRRVREEEEQEAEEERCCKIRDDQMNNDDVGSKPPLNLILRARPKVEVMRRSNAVGDASSITYTNQDDEPSTNSDYDSGTQTTATYDYSTYQSRRSRIVTRSPAFRAFLQSAFHQTE